MATRTTWKGVTRFYDKVDIVETNIPIVAGGDDAAAAGAAGTKKPGNFWQVTIQGRTLRTNGMNELLIPSRSLALAIATEFASQGRVILPTSQPLYNMTCSAIDNFATENAEEAEDVSEAPACCPACNRLLWCCVHANRTGCVTVHRACTLPRGSSV